jgi:hypothetical protein
MDDLEFEIQRLTALRVLASGLLRLKWLAAATRFEIAMARHDCALKYGYNRTEPRDDLGRWTDGGQRTDAGDANEPATRRRNETQVAADNQRENRTFRAIVVQLGLNKDQAQQLHRKIQGKA